MFRRAALKSSRSRSPLPRALNPVAFSARIKGGIAVRAGLGEHKRGEHGQV